MKKTIITMALAIASSTAFAQKAKSADTLQVTTTPHMHCPNCEKKIKGNIRFVQGIRKIETSVPNQTGTIVDNPKKCTYQGRVKAVEKIGYSIEKAGNKKGWKRHSDCRYPYCGFNCF